MQRPLQWLKCGPIQVKTGGVYRKEPRSTTEVPLLMCMPKWMDGFPGALIAAGLMALAFQGFSGLI